MRKYWLLFSQAVTVCLAAYFVVGTFKPQLLGMGPSVSTVQIQTDTSNKVPAQVGSFRVAAKTASASVVSINTSKTTSRSLGAGDPWFRFFFGEMDRNETQVGLGSGVIVSADGYVLTNNHVVEGADEVEVQLNDGRKTKAQVIGTDPDTDLAVLKIKVDKLPVITLGDMGSLQVGDPVLAIGNPFGVGQTVTGGIVSALGRNQLGINTFENFIQTDAAINPGNSGGALVDAQGNLMGINTAIYSRSGGSMGIGFAIPVSTTKQVLEDIIKDGQVTRGWIGVEPQELTLEMAETFRIQAKQGVMISGVLQGGPAALGGMQPGDVVTAVGGTPVRNVTELLGTIAALKPGTAARLSVVRKDRKLELTVTPAKRPKPKLLPR